MRLVHPYHDALAIHRRVLACLGLLFRRWRVVLGLVLQIGMFDIRVETWGVHQTETLRGLLTFLADDLMSSRLLTSLLG